MHKASDLEVNGLQQQTTPLGYTLVSEKQESTVTMGTDSPSQDRKMHRSFFPLSFTCPISVSLPS